MDDDKLRKIKVTHCIVTMVLLVITISIGVYLGRVK